MPSEELVCGLCCGRRKLHQLILSVGEESNNTMRKKGGKKRKVRIGRAGRPPDRVTSSSSAVDGLGAEAEEEEG